MDFVIVVMGMVVPVVLVLKYHSKYKRASAIVDDLYAGLIICTGMLAESMPALSLEYVTGEFINDNINYEAFKNFYEEHEKEKHKFAEAIKADLGTGRITNVRKVLHSFRVRELRAGIEVPSVGSEIYQD